MPSATRHSFLVRHAHALAVLAGALCFVFVASVSISIIVQQHVNEIKNAQRAASARAARIGISIEGMIAHLNQQPGLGCNEKTTGEIRAAMLEYRFISDVGLYDESGRLACTAGLGLFRQPLDDMPDALHGARGQLIWPSAPVLLGRGKIDAMVIRYGKFNFMIDPFAITDILDTGVDNIWFRDVEGVTHLLASGTKVDDSALATRRDEAALIAANVHIANGWIYITTPAEQSAFVFQTARSLRELANLHSVEVGMLLLLSSLLGIATISVLTPRLLAHDSIEKRITRLCDETAVRCVYQPIFDLKSGAIVGCEVLMRLQDGQRTILPDEAIPAILAKRLTWNLDRAVSTKAFRELKAHLPPVHNFKLAFNFFAEDIEYARLAPHLHGLLKASGRSDLKVNLEVTEYAYSDAMVAELRRFENDGFLVSVDDFGTGYSNLGMVKKLRPDFLKIDKSFVFEMEDSSIRSSLIPEIIGIALAIEAAVIAEGVENAAQAERLEQMGVRYAQGFHFARPMPIEEFVAFLLDRRHLKSPDVTPA